MGEWLIMLVGFDFEVYDVDDEDIDVWSDVYDFFCIIVFFSWVWFVEILLDLMFDELLLSIVSNGKIKRLLI